MFLMFRWFYKFFFILGVYGGLISFDATFSKTFGSEPAIFNEWDMYTALVLAFWGAFLDWRRF